MGIEKDRVVSLIEFAQQSARLKSKTVAAVTDHGVFYLHEHQIRGLPGICLNVNHSENGDEIWLTVQRLRETRPPEITSSVLRPWVEITSTPIEEPRLRQTTDGASLIAAGAHSSTWTPVHQDAQLISPQATIALADYDKATHVHSEFNAYLEAKWRPWADEEKRRRETIRLYSRLFTLKQQLEGDIVEAQLELVWGVGIGVWKSNGTTVIYPLVAQPVEMILNPETAEVEIRPCDIDARLEIDWYASVNNPGVANLEKAAREFFGKGTRTFSPFDRGTFEGLLHTAVTNLDANGIYWPNEVPTEDRRLPKPDGKLKVTDTWVLFARPRTNNLFLQDLDKLRKQAEEADVYPPAVAAVVTDPKKNNPIVQLPSFRGLSDSYHADERDTHLHTARDLYFPKPFNDEQVRIIQLLDVSNGVVVQGPPGTGKTHTIANVICHYLANGKRVLVTSMKDPALEVLQEQLPAEIRPLAISLLTSEHDGMKQFEHAIHKIASEVQSLDRRGTSREIAHLEEFIESLHGNLAGIDRKIGDWARLNLTKITLDKEEIDPHNAAREVIEGEGQFECLPDVLGIGPEFAPQFSDPDIVRLRDARRSLGKDIDYLDASLPQLVEFPDSKVLLQVHQNLSQFERLKQGVESGDIPALAESGQETFTLVHNLLTRVETLRQRRDEVLQTQQPWTVEMRERLRRAGEEDVLEMLEALGKELEQAVREHKVFMERPVTAPEGIELDAKLVEAVENLTNGKSPFGLKGLVGKSDQKKQLDGIRILGGPPADAQDWKQVANYLAVLKRLRELSLRWNALAQELHLEAVSAYKSEGGLAAADGYALYLKVKAVVVAESEVCAAVSLVFPNWPYRRELADNAQRLGELEKALQHHIAKNRLATTWADKERCQRVLEGRTGRAIEDLRRFFAETIGNHTVSDPEMHASWSELMAELSRVLGLGTHLATVREVCDRVEASGAPKYAAALKQAIAGNVDSLLPDNCRKAWRLRRLATYLDSIDAHQDLKKLAQDRDEVESDLARGYHDIVVKQTWLKLAENASPRIRSALQAYLNAIHKIGKGTGKRAVRYRSDARNAASEANPAVPCWIMPHYRVSESLPAELGCFDLVVIDEASQSDLTALPSLLRAKKVLIVGDDKQVSPEGVGLEEEKVRSLMSRFLGNQVETYGAQMSPDRSIYDLFKVVFADSSVMLKEHFRCVGPIIEYSKREFYNHELRPLRVPKASERLDPPLIDVLVENGYRRGEVNLPEIRYIVNEIKAIVVDPKMAGRSIGVVSLIGNEQAFEVWKRLTNEVGPEVIQRHRLACGDARTFQGKERDIMFLSMISAPNYVGIALSKDTFAQRFNVAASRARDRMYLVRSVGLEHLSEKDQMRRSMIGHFAAPFANDEARVEDFRKLCESPFEREMYDELTQSGYRITPQVRIGHYRIDMMVEGHNDARLAIECDGDKYHGPDKWADDMHRQRVLERTGLAFWRCFASAFIRRRKEMLDDLFSTLAERGIEPIGAEGAPTSVHTEHRVLTITSEPVTPVDFTDIGVVESAQSPVPVFSTVYGVVERDEAHPQPELDLQPSTKAPGLDEQRPAIAPPEDLPNASTAAAGRQAELLALADRSNVTKSIRDLQARGLTAEETVDKLILKLPSALAMVKAVREEAMEVEPRRALIQEKTPAEEETAKASAQAHEGRLTSEIDFVASGSTQYSARSVKNQKGGNKAMNLIIKFEHEKETKGTHRYKEITEEGKPAAVGILYIRKEALPTPVPATIEVTVKS